MTIDKFIDIINNKLTGLNTLVYEYTSKYVSFNRSILHTFELWLYDYPSGTRHRILGLTDSSKEDGEVSLIEFLFDIIITESYKKWPNYNKEIMEENGLSKIEQISN